MTYRAYGQTVITSEAEALSRLALDEHFDRAVDLLLKLKPEGRVVVSGMGKAGFIAMKTSATLASTGTPSYFLHPAEAFHGDLGRYTAADICLFFSNGGETMEIVRCLAHTKKIGCPSIAITGTHTSTLGTHADVVLSTGKVEEAGPHGLAPTTSTAAMLALGDALAMTVLHNRDFTPEHFAVYHPGGSLGRSLSLVTDIMRVGDELCVVSQNVTAAEVLHRITMTKGRPGAAAIVDDAGVLSGVFTDGNLRRCLEKRGDFLSRPISEVMGTSPKTITASRLAREALEVMSQYKIDQLIVVDESNVPIGMIDVQDVVSLKE